MSKEESEKL